MFKSINRYIIYEYIKSLFVVIAVMLSIVLLINLLDEFNFFKSKKDLKFIYFIIFTILKIPNVLINLFPFVILFAGIVFYLKIYNHNEVISLRVMVKNKDDIPDWVKDEIENIRICFRNISER